MTMLHSLVELCKGQCMTMCSRVWSSAWPQGQLRGELGKNRCRYLPMGAWPVVMRVKQVHSAFVKLMEGSQDPPLE